MADTSLPDDQIITANPFGLMFEWFNADYERKIERVEHVGRVRVVLLDRRADETTDFSGRPIA